MQAESKFILKNYQINKEEYLFKWSAPSNIALVKYWGKIENLHQIPANPSISFTLNNCKTITELKTQKINETEKFSFDFYFDNEPKEDFKPKIETFLERIFPYCPYLKQFHFIINTSNTFPHSSGIASSASGMAALAINIMNLEKEISQISDDFFYEKASFLARLGSGSACRSIKGNVVIWGENNSFSNSSNLFGIPFNEKLHDNFVNFQDTILLVDKGEKQVSSTVGHNLMVNHPFAENRFNQAHENLEKLKTILQNGNLEAFIALVESEALTLHAMMMTSMPYFILMKPNTLQIINKIWQFRNQTQIPVCFTLDAGANVHVLYPEKYKEKVLQFITNELVEFCQKNQYICDQIGNGVENLN